MGLLDVSVKVALPSEVVEYRPYRVGVGDDGDLNVPVAEEVVDLLVLLECVVEKPELSVEDGLNVVLV